NPLSTTGRQAQYGSAATNSYIVEPQLSYVTNIGNGKLNAFVGSSWQHTLSEGNYLLGVGHASDILLRNRAAATSLTIRTNSHSLYRYNSVFGRVNYSFSNRYIINGT